VPASFSLRSVICGGHFVPKSGDAVVVFSEAAAKRLILESKSGYSLACGIRTAGEIIGSVDSIGLGCPTRY
jgi:hypothetical protein